MFKPARFRLSRQSLRPSSTTSQAAEAASQSGSKAKAAASNAVSKASEGLSKVTSAAGPALSGAAKGAGEALGKATGRTGRLIKFVRCKFVMNHHCFVPGCHLSIGFMESMQVAQRRARSSTMLFVTIHPGLG